MPSHLQRSLQVTLDLIAGSDACPQRVVEFGPETAVTIGRASGDPSKELQAEKDNLWLTSEVVTRNHARLYYRLFEDEYKLVLEDIGSRHGTHVSDRRKLIKKGEQYVIEQGDIVQFGSKITRGSEDYNPPVFQMSYIENFVPMDGAQPRTQGYGLTYDYTEYAESINSDDSAISSEAQDSVESVELEDPEEIEEEEDQESEEEEVETNYDFYEDEDADGAEPEDEDDEVFVEETTSYLNTSPDARFLKYGHDAIPKEDADASHSFINTYGPPIPQPAPTYLNEWYEPSSDPFISPMGGAAVCELYMPVPLEPQTTGVVTNNRSNSMAIPSLLNGNEPELVPSTPIGGSQNSITVAAQSTSRKRKIIVLDDDEEDEIEITAEQKVLRKEDSSESPLKHTKSEEKANEVVQVTTLKSDFVKETVTTNATVSHQEQRGDGPPPAKRSRFWSAVSHISVAALGGVLTVAGMAMLPDGTFGAD